MSIANSPLFKTAMAGSDSNWGRIIMALGKSDVKLDAKKISIKFGDFLIFSKSKNFSSKNLSKINNYLLRDNITISISIGNKKGKSRVWTCDFTKKYISINADYRS
jgi:glutamate N-acetyltransferase/amino-acid N-acetyltransferase